MSNKKEDDSFSTAKTNSSSINKDTSSKNEEDELYHKTRTRGGVKHKINNFQPGRATISVPLSSFSGISHNASFQSKLLFFNGGKPRPKFQHIPYAHEKVPEDSKKKNPLNKFEKKTEKKVEKKVEKKNENDFDDIDSNININQIMESKNKNTNNDNKNSSNDNEDPSLNNEINNDVDTNNLQLLDNILKHSTPMQQGNVEINITETPVRIWLKKRNIVAGNQKAYQEKQI